MTFIVILMALLVERFFDWSHLRRFEWYVFYQRRLSALLPLTAPAAAFAAMLAPLLLLVFLTTLFLNSVFYGLLTVVFHLVILLYCFGPRNLWADIFACINALTHSDLQQALQPLKTTFGIQETDDLQHAHKQLLDRIFIAANRRLFAVVCWYVVLGPVGALFYRLATLSALANTPRWETILNWVPVRILTFIFALGGHFTLVMAYWRKNVLQTTVNNDHLLVHCGYAALDQQESARIAEDGSTEKAAVNLLDRALVIALVMAAMVILII